MSSILRSLPKNGAAADTRTIKPQGNMVLLRDPTPESTIEVVEFGAKEDGQESGKAKLLKVEALSDDYERPVLIKEGQTVLANGNMIKCGAFGLDKKLYLAHISAVLGVVE